MASSPSSTAPTPSAWTSVIWVEPEMVNPDTDLYPQASRLGHALPRPAAHRGAQSAAAQPRPSRRDASTSSTGWTSWSPHNDIAFSEVGLQPQLVGARLGHRSRPGLRHPDPTAQKEICVASMCTHLYGVLDRLRARHPKLEIESCSGRRRPRRPGNSAPYTDEVWPSDNTDALRSPDSIQDRLHPRLHARAP